MKKYYLHTVDGAPGAMMGDQICHLSRFGPRTRNKLVADLATIKKQQRASEDFRRENGFQKAKYDYVTVYVP
jgi:hypothetical protein